MRALRRFTTVGIILVLALALNMQLVEAGRLWCKSDPVVTLNGQTVSITVAIPLEYLLLVDGPVIIEIKTPPSVDRQLIVNDVGFLHGSIVTFTDGGGAVKDELIPVQIDASVSIDSSRLAPGETVPLQITVLTDDLLYATAQGTTEHTTMELVVRGR